MYVFQLVSAIFMSGLKFFNEFLEIQVFIGPPDCFFPQVLLMAFLPTSIFGENTLAEFLTQTD